MDTWEEVRLALIIAAVYLAVVIGTSLACYNLYG